MQLLPLDFQPIVKRFEKIAHSRKCSSQGHHPVLMSQYYRVTHSTRTTDKHLIMIHHLHMKNELLIAFAIHQKLWKLELATSSLSNNISAEKVGATWGKYTWITFYTSNEYSLKIDIFKDFFLQFFKFSGKLFFGL